MMPRWQLTRGATWRNGWGEEIEMDYWNLNDAAFANLVGKTLTSIERDGDEKLTFRAGSQAWVMYHHQDCCEHVRIDEVIGDLGDLVNDGPVLLAEEVSNADGPVPEYDESHTWTFYKLRTLNGDVTIRWLGESNGYYSESVSFSELPA